MNVPALDRQLLKSFRHLHGVQFSHKKGPIDLNLGVSTAIPVQKKRSQPGVSSHIKGLNF